MLREVKQFDRTHTAYKHPPHPADVPWTLASAAERSAFTVIHAVLAHACISLFQFKVVPPPEFGRVSLGQHKNKIWSGREVKG